MDKHICSAVGPRVLIVLCVCLLLSASPIQAQVIATLRFDQPVNGQITRDNFRQVYSFSGKAGDVIDLALTVTGGMLDPILLLTDSQNRLLARDDDGGGSLNAAINTYPLPVDGAYFVIVARYGQEQGLTLGSYTLSLSKVGRTGSPAGSLLRYGDSVVGDIAEDKPEQVYSFAARRGDVIRIIMQRISGDLDPSLILADANGTVLSVNDEDVTKPGTLDAALYDFLILKTDNYLIVATRFGREAGSTRGGFTLSLERVAPETLGFKSDKPLLLDYGDTATGEIDDETLTRYYQFETKKGDVITVQAERTRGNLDPTLTLFSPEGKELTRHDQGQRGQSARISLFTIPRDGFYRVDVSRFNKVEGFTAGSFRLTLVGRQGVTVGTNGALILSYGGAVTSMIDSGQLDQQYVFQGKVGEIVTIVMEPTSGDLLPYVILFDPARRLVAQNDPNRPVAARLQGLKLTANGIYVIVATRHGRAGGVSKGGYLLTLTRERN